MAAPGYAPNAGQDEIVEEEVGLLNNNDPRSLCQGKIGWSRRGMFRLGWQILLVTSAVVLLAITSKKLIGVARLAAPQLATIAVEAKGKKDRKKICWSVKGAHMKGEDLLIKVVLNSSSGLIHEKVGGRKCAKICRESDRCMQVTFIGWQKTCLLYKRWSEDPIEFRDGMYQTSYCNKDVDAINATVKRVYKKKPWLPVWYSCTWPTDYKNGPNKTIYSKDGHPRIDKTAPQLCNQKSKDCGWYQADCSFTKCCAKRDFDKDFTWVGHQCVKKNEYLAACMSPSDAAKMKSQGWDGTIIGGYRLPRKLDPAPPGVLVQPTSLYCFTVVMWHMAAVKGDSEAALASNWRNQGRGIMQCDGHKIYEGVNAKLEAWGSFSNIDAFLVIWERVGREKEYLKYGWTVKVDADAVFFPQRLKQHLGNLRTPQGARVYLKNVPFKFQFLGALEIMTREALQVFLTHKPECNGGGDHSGGEDWFTASCLDGIGVDHQEDFKLLHDMYANGGGDKTCTDQSYVAYHYYKTVEGWNGCWSQSSR
mmetsp:Transcript_132260/g.263910  ORF Transcript_132260/g.263910 Transcript_132260/m.263910 type:complete len:534 (+) Transcript_132260:33-1634(+)